MAWLAFGIACMASVAVAKETPIQRAELPSAVERSFTTRYPGATVLGLSKEVEKRVTLFEIEMRVAGNHVDASFDSNGGLREEEAEIRSSELPQAVRAALAHSAHSTGVIERAERVTTGDPKAAPHYELLVVEGGNRFELEYDAGGRLIRSAKAGAED